MIKHFISYYKPHKVLFFWDMVCALLVAVCDLFYPVIAKNIINDYVPNKNLRLLLVWSGVLLFIYLAKAALNYFISYWGHIVGVRMQGDMREDIFKKLQKLPFSFFDKTKTGSLMSRIVNDLFETSELAHHGPEDLFLSVIMFIGSFVILAFINIYLALIVYAFVPFVILYAVIMRGRMYRAFKRSREEVAVINAGIETAIAGVRVSRAYTAENFENEKFKSKNESFKKIRGVALEAMSRFMSGMTFLTDFLYLVSLVAGGLFFFNGIIDTGEFAAFILYMVMLLKPINRFVSLFQQYLDGMTGFKRFEEIIALADEYEPKNPKNLGKVEGRIEFSKVSFAYENETDGKQERVIEDLSVVIEKGETVALVGPSGGGKTTLCRLIPRFYDIKSGSITIDGTDIRDISSAELRKNIGMVDQDVFLFDGTVRENIAYGKLDATDEEIQEAAKRARIDDYIQTLEKGYDTEVGERGIRLSGGQKQRISIARVFLKNPPILILDEATSALDNATEMQIQAALDELSMGRTVIVVAHRLSTVKNADEIIVLTQNGITERGTHEQLISNNGLYKELYSYQFR